MILALAAAARLLTGVPSPPVITSAELTGLAQTTKRAQGEAPPRSEGAPEADLIEPNSSGVVDLANILTNAQRAEDEQQPANPFRLRFHPPLSARTVVAAVEAIIRGAPPSQDCCVLNDQVLRTGETFEGMVLARIGRDRIVLQFGGRRLALPAGDRPITLRLPF